MAYLSSLYLNGFLILKVDFAPENWDSNNVPSQPSLKESKNIIEEVSDEKNSSASQIVESAVEKSGSSEQKHDFAIYKDLLVKSESADKSFSVDSVKSLNDTSTVEILPTEISKEPITNNDQVDNNLYKSFNLMIIEPLEIKLKVPSAPIAISSGSLIQHDFDLPCDNLKFESHAFPLSLDCIADQVNYDLEHLSQLQLFTSEQLRAFYENPLLEGEATIVESFLGCNQNLETHPLFQYLNSYLRSRIGLKSIVEELAQLNRDLEGFTSQIWTLETKKIFSYGECSDRKKVKAQDEYPGNSHCFLLLLTFLTLFFVGI